MDNLKKIILSFMVLLSVISAAFVVFAAHDIDDAKQAYTRNNPPPSEIILADGQGAISQEQRHNRLNVILDEDGTVSINNGFTIIDFPDAQPFVDENGRTQVPVRAIMEMLVCAVDWDEGTKTVTVTHCNGDVVSFVIGSDIMMVNGKPLHMDTVAIIKDNRTCIPVRFVAEAVGYEVDWLNNVMY